MTPRLAFALAGAALLGPAQNLHAAPVATLVCTSNPAISAHLSYYDVGASNTSISSGGSGGGAGKVTYKPVVLHTGLAQFNSFFQLAVSGRHTQECTLTATTANGSQIQFLLKDVLVQSADAFGQHGRTPRDEPAGYTEATLLFSTITVTTSSSIDDSGTTGGWDVVKNKQE